LRVLTQQHKKTRICFSNSCVYCYSGRRGISSSSSLSTRQPPPKRRHRASSSQLLRSVSPASVSRVHSVEDELIKMQQAEHQARLVFMEADHKANMRVRGVEYQIEQVNLQKAMGRRVNPEPLSPLPSNPTSVSFTESPAAADESDPLYTELQPVNPGMLIFQ